MQPTQTKRYLFFGYIVEHYCTFALRPSKFQKTILKTSGCLLDTSKVHETFGKLANGSPVTSTCSSS